jgi:hypothetical protein
VTQLPGNDNGRRNEIALRNDGWDAFLIKYGGDSHNGKVEERKYKRKPIWRTSAIRNANQEQ